MQGFFAPKGKIPFALRFPLYIQKTALPGGFSLFCASPRP
jgi:hypothetical protein